MENNNNPRTKSYDDKQLVASGNQTEPSTVKVSQSQNSRKSKMSEPSCDPGKQKHDLCFLLLPISTSRACLGGDC